MALTSRPIILGVVRHPRLLRLQRRLAKRLDDTIAVALDNGLMMAVISVVIIVGVTAFVAVKVSFIFEDLARNVAQLYMR